MRHEGLLYGLHIGSFWSTLSAWMPHALLAVAAPSWIRPAARQVHLPTRVGDATQRLLANDVVISTVPSQLQSIRDLYKPAPGVSSPP
jgi:hypothetical protein